MTSSLRTGQGKVRSTFGTSTEYLFHESSRRRSPAARDRCLKPPLRYFAWPGTGNPDRTKCHHRIACELRTHRRDTCTSLLPKAIRTLKLGPNMIILGQTPKSDIPPNVVPKIVTPGNYLQIWDSSATMIGQLAVVTIFGAILGGIPLSGPYP